MRRLARLVATLAPAVTLLHGCADKDKDDTTDDTDGPPDVWSIAFDAESLGALSGVWGSGPSDVYAVGGTETSAIVQHFDGTSWSAMTPPDTDLLVWCHGFGPDDVYAVGEGGAFVRWDGAAWTSFPTGTTEPLWGIFGFAPDDLWLVGGAIDAGDPLLLHWDGVEVVPYALPEDQNSRFASSLFKVWGIDGTMWAVGQRGLILQRVGDEWLEVSAGPEANDDFVALWGTSADHVVAVGGRANAQIATWDGATWTTTKPGQTGGLSAVFMESPTKTVVGGINGFVGTFDPTTGELVREAPVTVLDVHAAWGDGTGRTWAVGGDFLRYTGTAIVREE